MPIYEFACDDCGDAFEALVMSFSKIAGVTCPECSSTNIQKKMSTFAVQGDSSRSAGTTSFSSSATSCATGST